jgi:ankyrin repeat protein
LIIFNQRLNSTEEKMDEFYTPTRTTIAAGQASPPRDENRHNRFREGGSRSPKNTGGYADLLREFTLFLHHPELVSQQQQPAVYADADRLVRDAMRSLSDTRPPATFVLYPGGVVVHNTDNNNNDNNNNNNHADADDMQLQEHHPPDPQPQGLPIFDGSVANATPAFAAGQGGGAGTALHAVTALDHPLTMALLLAMGADTRSCHTAFRRLVQHEAACNGSIQCLTLLLELGNQYGNEQLNHRASSKIFNEKPAAAAAAAAAVRSPDTSMDFPFLPRRTGSTFTPLNMYTKPTALWKKPEPAVSTEPQTDMLSLLRLCYALTKEVATGSISELDAARKLLQQAALSEHSKTALASQCGFRTRSNAARNMPFLRPGSPIVNAGSADGHGNTPLHWAAFKNETACVSLLLKYHADPNARAQPSGWTPLHDAAYSNGRDAIALLIDAGAAVDARANSGATPLCFAAQEDAAEAAELLLIRGADLTTRCAGGPATNAANHPNNDPNAIPPPPAPHSRFSGYTPLHYCAHYNAHKAAKVLLRHHTAAAAMEILDLNERLPIHVAVARGSSDVLRELLRAGARVETRSLNRHHSSASASPSRRAIGRRFHSAPGVALSAPSSPRRNLAAAAAVRPPSPESPSTPPRNHRRGRSCSNSVSTTPVSSPMLRSMIPSQPIQSSKPWNCLSQRSIDECRQLISEVEQNWTPDRHSLFTPGDRRAVAELLRVGKRLELEGSFTFIDMWPEVLSFCGRGWFEVDEENTEATDMDCLDATETADDDNLALPTFC